MTGRESRSRRAEADSYCPPLNPVHTPGISLSVQTEETCFVNNAHISGASAARYYVKLGINGLQTLCLVDSGSACTIINHRFYKRVPCAPTLDPCFLKVETANGSSLNVLGETQLNIDGVKTDVIVTCNDLETDVILGTNLLRCGNISFREGKMNLYLPDGSVNRYRLQCSAISTPQVAAADTQTQVDSLLTKYHDIFAQTGNPLKEATSLGLGKLEVQPGTTPIRQRPYRLPPGKKEVVEKEVSKMLSDGIIRPSQSPWSSPVTLAPKSDGSIRFCIDYRQLNKVSIQDAHPLPNIQDILDSLQGAKVFSTMDLKSGFWQMGLEEESKPRSAFACHVGLYEFNRLPFGHTNAPAQFQRAMEKVLTGLIGKICFVYIDDLIVFSRNDEEHLQHLEKIFERLRAHGLQLKRSKCFFLQREIKVLGWMVNEDGISADPSKFKAIREMPRPTTPREVKRFLGMVGYYRQLIPSFADTASPLTDLTRGKANNFVWTAEAQYAFEKLKENLISDRIMLSLPDFSLPFQLYTDASQNAVGSVLVQEIDGVKRPLSYFSKKLSHAQQKWCATEKEAYALILSLKKFQCYLQGHKFVVYTDHKPLKSLFFCEQKNTKLQRWAVTLAEYNPTIRYVEGKNNIHADLLSRPPVETACCKMAVKRADVSITQPPPDVLPPMDKKLLAEDETLEIDGINLQECAALQKEEFPKETEKAEKGEEPYFIENGLLFSLSKIDPVLERLPKLLLPQKWHKEVINRAHNEVAHGATDKTGARILDRYTWPGMYASIRGFIKQCPHCIQVSRKTEKRAGHPYACAA